jgi:uncharacterized protein (UPF0276 family)
MSVDIEQLPTLGVGASLSLSSKPDPVALVNSAGGPSFVEYAGLVDVDAVIDEVERVRAAGAPVLFHPSYINFCGSFANSSIWLEETARHIKAVHSPWFAQDCAYCFWQEGAGYSSQLGYFIPPIFNQNSLELAIQRVKEVQAVMSVPVAIEPPPLSFIAGTIPLFTFFGELSRATDCALLLDMGHLVSYEMASGRKVRDALDELPCERVVEVHVAGGRLKKGANGSTRGSIYVDAHECTILEETWQMFEAMLPELPNVKAVCYECEGVNENTVLMTLKKIRQIVKKKSASQSLLNSLEAVA